MPNNNIASSSSISSEQYWNNHIRLKHNSGLTRVEYCRKNNLKIYQLEYWERKQRASTSNTTKLLPLKLVSEESLPKEVSQIVNHASPLLCKLKLKNGGNIKVYDIKTLSIILEVLK